MLKKTAANKFNNPEGKCIEKNAKGDKIELGTKTIYDENGIKRDFVGELEYANVLRFSLSQMFC